MQVNLDKSLDLMHNKQVGGVWLSLVERYVRDVEVAGSNPVTPTKEKESLEKGSFFVIRIRKNPAKQDSPPAAGRISDMIPFRRSAIPRRGFLLYRNHDFHTLM